MAFRKAFFWFKASELLCFRHFGYPKVRILECESLFLSFVWVRVRADGPQNRKYHGFLLLAEGVYDENVKIK